jgi:H+-transporting ATPase
LIEKVRIKIMASSQLQVENPKAESSEGLTTEEVRRRLEKYGYNEIAEKQKGFLARLGKRFWGIVPWMLEITALLTLVLGKYIEFAIVLFLLLFNAGMSLMQERRARMAMRTLKQGLKIQSRVKRDAKWSVVPARTLVPGDLTRIRAGDLVPADVRIIEGDLSVDQSALTGESLSVEKSKGELVYSASAVKSGEATGIVSATGRNTYSGRTVELVKLAKPKLHAEEITTNLTRWLATMVAISLGVAFAYALLTGYPAETLLPLAIILSISVVPVALPTLFNMNMALGSLELAKKGVLVTRPSAIEDIAAMDVICADKTGTMTYNKLFISQTQPYGEFVAKDILMYGSLASNESNQDPIDVSFIEGAKAMGMSIDDDYSRVNFVPFDPHTRITRAEIQTHASTHFYVVKGAVGKVLESCVITGEQKHQAESDAERLANDGMRVIAVAQGKTEKDLGLVGLAGIADKIRSDTGSVVSHLKDLGVSVKMLTGDSLPVASVVGRDIGLDKIVKIEKLGSGQVASENKTESNRNGIENSDGIAEIYPEDKYAIVKSLQANHHVVGMMGDGVNDAPALKQAEVGIAVKNSTDIAKDSASAVFTGEGLGAVAGMVITGRTVHQRIFSWLLTFVTMKIRVVEYIVAMVILSGLFVVSLYSMVLLMIFGDFATMSISTDRTGYSRKPDSFDVSWLFKVGVPLGVLALLEGLVITFAGFQYLGINSSGEIYAFVFEYLALSAIFNIFSVRERSYFWKSRPGNLLIVTMIVEVFVVGLIAAFGFLDLAPLGYIPALILAAYVLVVNFLVNDAFKVFLIRKFHRNETTSYESFSADQKR